MLFLTQFETSNNWMMVSNGLSSRGGPEKSCCDNRGPLRDSNRESLRYK